MTTADLVPHAVFTLDYLLHDASELRIIGDFRIRSFFEEQIAPATQKTVTEVRRMQRFDKCVVDDNCANVLLSRARGGVFISERNSILRAPIIGIQPF